MDHSEPGLFNLVEEEETSASSPADAPLTEEQIEAIRRAFTEAGLDSMQERQELIEACTARPVTNIRELRAQDYRRVLKRISEKRQPSASTSGSAWDNRDEDTWIDKL
ncbi:hypothetical protein [Arthrobacter koreensis]|uniref:hypothetical protein n=1 Tax=Arthrobacter koreensis TaxID=199136 RepID=UPI000B19F879|nr:hypothetical protein [Arthrobacter koreensis]